MVMMSGKQFKRITYVPRVDPPPAPVVMESVEVDATSPKQWEVRVVEVPAPTVAKTPALLGKLPSITKKFVLAGRAMFSVSNPKGDHYTFRVKARTSEWPLCSGKMSTTHFLSVKCEGGRFPYRYIGMVGYDGTVKCSAKSEFVPGSKEYDVANWALRAAFAGKFIPDGYEIRNVGKCGRCSRTLTDPESIDRGIGPDCWEMMGN